RWDAGSGVRSRARRLAPSGAGSKTADSRGPRTAGSFESHRCRSWSRPGPSRPRARTRSVGEPEHHDNVAVVHAGRIRPLRLLPEPDLRPQRPTGGHGDVLLAIDRVTDDPPRLRRAEIERPQLLTVLRVHRAPVPVRRALEHEVARGGQRVADERGSIRPFPDALVLVHVDRA